MDSPFAGASVKSDRTRRDNLPTRALVLAGGGYVASSWEIGIATGLADAGVDLRTADLFVGTSAGARVALDLASDLPLEDIYQRRATAAVPSGGPRANAGPRLDWVAIRAGVAEARAAGGSAADILRRYGALALAHAPGPDPERRATIAAQLPATNWPARRILVPVLDAATGERRVFDRDSGPDPVDAIIGATASFGAAPLTFEGRTYIDGGYHSSDNADLAVGCERVLILALRSPPEAMRLIGIDAGLAALRDSGAQVEAIHPDEATIAALAPTGGQMNPASGPPAAIAGRDQGRSIADKIARIWT